MMTLVMGFLFDTIFELKTSRVHSDLRCRVHEQSLRLRHRQFNASQADCGHRLSPQIWQAHLELILLKIN